VDYRPPRVVGCMSTAKILKYDVELSSRLHIAEKPGSLRNAAVFLAHSGDSWFWGLGLVILWYAGSAFWEKWAMLELVAISVLAALVMALKFLIRRRRPEGAWGSIYRNTDPHSFPSGHAARAFLIAVIATALGPAWAAVVLWIWAPLVSLARVAMGVHYIVDVVAGLAVGVVIGMLFVQIQNPLLTWLAGLLPFLLR
jgi:membrane-associated phospholipid phosphatase